MMPEQEKLLTVQQVADYLTVKKITIYKMVSARRIPHSHVGSRVVFRKEAVDQWLDENSVEPLTGKKTRRSIA